VSETAPRGVDVPGLFRPGAPFFLLAGPCVLEDDRLNLTIAEALARLSDDLKLPLVFKASFDKANRSSAGSPRGPGLEAGLRKLARVRDESGLPLVTDVHEPEQCAAVAEVADVLQIPAFLCRQTDLLVAAGAVLALHSAVPHKELRFVFPVLPLLCALAAMGWDRLRAASPPRVRALGWGALATSLLLSAASLGRLTFGALGQYGRARRFDSALDDGGAVNRLLLRAHALPDLCGLKVETRHLAWTGGHSYLHRPVPLYGTPGPARSTGHFNYAVTGRGGPGREVAAEGSQALVRLRADCVPDPSYTWRLP